jgi:hypothetical protein
MSAFAANRHVETEILSAPIRETVIHQKRIRQAGAVERAVNLYGYNGLPVTRGYSLTSSVTLTAKIS